MAEDMHYLLGKYFSGEASEEETAMVRQWAAASEEHAAEFRLMEELWKASGVEPAVRFDTEAAWTSVDSRLQVRKKSAGGARIIRLAVGIAASLILVLGLWWMLGKGNNMQNVVAGADAQLVQLEDGSKVFLRKGASLQYPKKFDKDDREVSLQGEAFFDISRDPSRPFKISAGEAQVEVLGTSFSLNTGNGKVELVVKTGRVRFASGKNARDHVIVSAGEKAALINGTVSKERNADENFDAWQTRKLIFRDEPLTQVLQLLNNYYKVNIILNKGDSAQLIKTRVTTNFNNQDLASVLKELSLITTYHIEKRSDTEYEISIK
jgi:transmembrane sensor